MTAMIPDVVAAMDRAIGPGPFSLHEPRLSRLESEFVQQCLDSTFVSSVGPFVDRFEAELAAYTGAGYAIATVNGTSALHVALILAGVLPGDEVLVPALTFVATAAAVTYAGAIPVFIDSEFEGLGVDPVALAVWLKRSTVLEGGQLVNRTTGRRISAVVPMHTFGHPCDLEGLKAVADDFRLALVEDAAESLGSYRDGRHTGTTGRLGILSFNGNKIITTGGGGAILTDDPDLARRAKHLTTTAKVPHRWEYTHDEVGFNYRLPNINAALGCAQLERLPEFLESKRRLFDRYSEAFAALADVRVLREPRGCRSNYWLQTLILDPGAATQRDEVLEALNGAGYMARPAWKLIPTLAPYAKSPCAPLPVAAELATRIVNVPSSAGLA